MTGSLGVCHNFGQLFFRDRSTRRPEDLRGCYADRRMAAETVAPHEPLADFPPGRFKVTAQIGDGAHGDVLRAWDHQLWRDVALKTMLDPTALEQFGSDKLETVGVDQPTVEAMIDVVVKLAEFDGRYTPQREARLLALVKHPNVIQVLDIGLLDGCTIAIVMPYLEGGTLAQRKFTGSWEEVLDVALQIGWGLAALHDAGILHRDLKPSNVIFDGNGRPLIADLGLACRIQDTEALAERVGTRAYMAPDVLTRGFQDVCDDLYAFCMIVYEMLNGRSPFASMQARELGRVSASTRAGMPAELHGIIARGLAPDADRRWPSMKALLRALERMRQPKPVSRRWPWAAAPVVLAAGIAIGVFVDERTAKADECAAVMDELARVWNDQARTELVGAFGTRKAGDGLDEWAMRWLAVRAQECTAAKDAEQSTEPTPCSASIRDRFQATVHAFRSPLLRRGLKFASVIAELPAPEHCIDHPDDADWGYGGLLELPNVDVEVEALASAGDLELAHARQAEYMRLALEQGSELGIARATYFRAEIHRLEGKLDEAAQEFDLALERSIDIGLPVFTAECLLKLTAIAGTRGDMGVVDAYALMARKLFARYRSERVAELLQVQGLALMTGSERERGVALLLQAVEMREEQLRTQSGSREWLSQARESYARGLLAVDRAAEAIEYLDLALKMHQEEFGHGTWRTRAVLMQKFSALIELRRFDETEPVLHAILKLDDDAGNWQRYTEDARWMAHRYESAGELRAAKIALLEGRAAAVEHELPDEVARFDLALGALMGE
jgi:tetratricopeptide (TPR) repeat protein